MLDNINWAKYKNSGDLFLPPHIRTFLKTNLIGTSTSLFYISYWSIVHMISGILLAILLGRFTSISASIAFLTAFLIHSLWEAWQALITLTPNTTRGKIDTVVDTVLFMVGFSFCYYSHVSL